MTADFLIAACDRFQIYLSCDSDSLEIAATLFSPVNELVTLYAHVFPDGPEVRKMGPSALGL